MQFVYVEKYSFFLHLSGQALILYLSYFNYTVHFDFLTSFLLRKKVVQAEKAPTQKTAEIQGVT